MPAKQQDTRTDTPEVKVKGTSRVRRKESQRGSVSVLNVPKWSALHVRSARHALNTTITASHIIITIIVIGIGKCDIATFV